jgi:phosphoglycolate phosphatase-like HAD superfamily hydrolase
MRDEFGVTDPFQVELSGRTDRGIAAELFERHAIENCEHNWQRFRDAYLRQLAVELPQRQGSVLPGVASLLATLAVTPDVALGLLTGNVRQGAALKLEHYRLHGFFSFGGFGDEHAHRDLVAAAALQSARRHLNSPHRDVWVIGDTPLDVRCARAIGARSLAVATGSHPADELRACEPDLLVPTLESADDFLQRIATAPRPK